MSEVLEMSLMNERQNREVAMNFFDSWKEGSIELINYRVENGGEIIFTFKSTLP